MPRASNPIENLVQRRLLRAFLDAERVEVVILRPTLTKTAGGGLRKDTPVKIPIQVFRLVPFKKRLTAMTRDTPDGNIINLPYVLLGYPDADVRAGDYFEVGDGVSIAPGMYDVISIEPNRSYRTAVNVTFRGKNDSTWG